MTPPRVPTDQAELRGVAQARRSPIPDSAKRRWDEEFRRAGMDVQRSTAIDIGVPTLAIATLGLAGILAIFAPNEDRGMIPAGIILIVAAMLPWVFWLIVGDQGPHWQPIVFILGPIALLSIGHWFFASMGPGSDLAYPLLAFPCLLLIVLGVSIAQTPFAIRVVIAAYAAYGLPLLITWVTNKNVHGTTVMVWHVGFALSLIAGYVVRFSYHANATVIAARETLARQAAEEERRQIARDVHDVVAHTLAVTMLHITAARMAVIRSDADTALKALEQAEHHGRSSLADVRRIVHVLRADDDSDLETPQSGIDRIGTLVDVYRAAGLPVDLTLSLHHDRISPATGMMVFRILQEALTNAARHGKGPATVELRTDDREVSLAVENPIGAPSSGKVTGSGLTGIRERVAAANGDVQIGNRDGRWSVLVTIPIEDVT